MTVPTDQIRKGFKDALGGLHGLTAYATMPSNPRMPCVVPLPANWRYDDTMDASTMLWNWRLWFYLPKDDANASQLAFDAYISPDGATSVPQRLRDNPTLGGVVDSLRVIGGDQYLADGTTFGMPALGAFILVEVYV